MEARLWKHVFESVSLILCLAIAGTRAIDPLPSALAKGAVTSLNDHVMFFRDAAFD
jgi:hypothetical protein